MSVPYVEQSSLARIVLTVSAGAFVAGELSQGFRVRRGASRVDLRAEVVFRAMFLGGILVLPIGRAVTPGASIGGGAWVFGLGAALAWLGMLVRGSASDPEGVERVCERDRIVVTLREPIPLRASRATIPLRDAPRAAVRIGLPRPFPLHVRW